MPRLQTSRKRGSKRGVLARPLDALIFLLPLLLFYELVAASRGDRLIAAHLMQQFFNTFGRIGIWGPGLAAVVILLATHAASGERWTIHWRDVGYMYLEAVALSLPLFLINQLVPIASVYFGQASILDQLALGIGAGLYEELVFRLVLISFVVLVGVDLFKLDQDPVAVAAVALSAVLFAAHHHPPFGVEPFRFGPFVFRTLAGVYLAVVFWYRGYGSAAGCHAAYNVGLVLISAWR